MPYKDIERRRANDRKWYQNNKGKKRVYMARYKRMRREQGVCVSCGRQATVGSAFCAACCYKEMLRSRTRRENPLYAELVREGNRKRRQQYSDSHRCIVCSAPLQEGEERYCNWCRAMHQYKGIPRPKRGVPVA